MGWTELRPLQIASIEAVLSTRDHLILSASTAAGKTEAAFLPILSHLSASPEPIASVRAIYVGPLRALINDQFTRLEDLCRHLELPVHRWHGDVSPSHKKRLLENPSGILLITPESLESLFVNRSSQIAALFSNLEFVVIDELHAFLGEVRGRHLVSLLRRLQRLHPESPYRTLGLSATLGDLTEAKRFLDREHPENVRVLEDKPGAKDVRFAVHTYRTENGPRGRPEESDLGELEDGSAHAPLARRGSSLAEDLVDHCREGANMIFANSKRKLEIYSDLCRRLAENQRIPVHFLVHHGSLSREVREETETLLKSPRPATVFCSSTLEMGIDVGNIRMVGQIGAPHGVAATKQRLGRSGRRDDEPSTMRVYLECSTLDETSDLFDRLHLELIQAVAVTELLREGWVEPTRGQDYDLSTLSQQILSLIAQRGGLSAENLHRELCGYGAFPAVDPGLFGDLLRSLAIHEVVEQMVEGDLILGPRGEQIRHSMDFYGVFQTDPEYSVRHGSKAIGSLPMVGAPSRGDVFLLAGKRWQVVKVDPDRNLLSVKPSAAKKAPLFLGASVDLHPRIPATMREVLEDSTVYDYLDSTGRDVLEEARRARRDFGGDLFQELDRGRSAWMTWAGTRTQETLRAILLAAGIESVNRKIALVLPLPPDKARAAVGSAGDLLAEPQEIAKFVRPKTRRKYDPLLSDRLLETSLMNDYLDLSGAQKLLDEV